MLDMETNAVCVDCDKKILVQFHDEEPHEPAVCIKCAFERWRREAVGARALHSQEASKPACSVKGRRRREC